MKYLVKTSETVYFQILSSMSFLARANENTAKKTLKEILTSIKTLEEFPERNPVVPKLEIIGREVHKFVILNGRYIILYTIVENKVFIDKFLDSRKDNKIFDDLK